MCPFLLNLYNYVVFPISTKLIVFPNQLTTNLAHYVSSPFAHEILLELTQK